MNNVNDVIVADLNHIEENLGSELAGKLAGKSVLVTGGAGFLGYYLVQSLLHMGRPGGSAGGVRVVVLDNYKRGMPDWLEKLQASEDRLQVIEHDITSINLPQMEPSEYIIHGASIASPMYYRIFPIETMDANITGLRTLLDHALGRKESSEPVEGFLFFSSSEIYGDPPPEKIPTSEDYNGNVSCTGPRACYDESKRYGEALCVNFSGQHQLPITVARPFNNYGPGLRISDRRVLPDFARDILSDRDVVLLSDGSPTRTFCYVADAVVGYLKVLLKGESGQAYNVGTATPEISIRDLAEKTVSLAKDLFGYKGQVVFQNSEDADYLTDNPNRRCPDITKAESELGYHPGIPLDEGLKRSLLWYRENREQGDQ